MWFIPLSLQVSLGKETRKNPEGALPRWSERILRNKWTQKVQGVSCSGCCDEMPRFSFQDGGTHLPSCGECCSWWLSAESFSGNFLQLKRTTLPNQGQTLGAVTSNDCLMRGPTLKVIPAPEVPVGSAEASVELHCRWIQSHSILLPFPLRYPLKEPSVCKFQNLRACFLRNLTYNTRSARRWSLGFSVSYNMPGNANAVSMQNSILESDLWGHNLHGVKMYSFSEYVLMSFQKCTGSCSHHHNQDMEHIHYPQKFSYDHLYPISYPHFHFLAIINLVSGNH